MFLKINNETIIILTTISIIHCICLYNNHHIVTLISCKYSFYYFSFIYLSFVFLGLWGCFIDILLIGRYNLVILFCLELIYNSWGRQGEWPIFLVAEQLYVLSYLSVSLIVCLCACLVIFLSLCPNMSKMSFPGKLHNYCSFGPVFYIFVSFLHICELGWVTTNSSCWFVFNVANYQENWRKKTKREHVWEHAPGPKVLVKNMKLILLKDVSQLTEHQGCVRFLKIVFCCLWRRACQW